MPQLFATHFGSYEVEQDVTGPRLKPFRFDPEPSAVGQAYLDMADSAERVRHPMVRRSLLDHPVRHSGHLRGREELVPVDWDTALELIVQRLSDTLSTHGNRGIFAGSYGWASAGRFHHAPSQLKRFLNLMGGFTRSVNSYSFGAAEVLLPHVIGAEFAVPGAASPSWDLIVDNCEILVAFGGMRLSNAQVSGGGATIHRNREWLDRVLDAGIRVVVLSADRKDAPDPRIEHHFLRPNSDVSIMLAAAHLILSEGLADLDFIDRYTVGAAAYIDYVLGRSDGIAKDALWAADISGLPRSFIEELSRSLARQPSLINLSWSLQRARFGEQGYWAAIALASLIGQIGRDGCGISFGLTATGSIGSPIQALRGPSIDQGRNAVPDYIPVARITELLERPGGTLDYDGHRIDLPDIDLIWWAGGNPYHHHQDLNRLRRAWEKPSTIIINEPVWSATARLADIVLPSSLPFERDDLSVGSRDNWIIASRQVLPPQGETRNDFEIFSALAERLGIGELFTAGLDERGWIEKLYQGYRDRNPGLPDFPQFWDAGFATLDGQSDQLISHQPFRDFVHDPVRAPLATPSGKIEIGSKTIASFGYTDCPGHPMWLEPEEWLGAPLARRYPLQLLSPQPATRLHSQLESASPSQDARVAGREAARFNPANAAERGIAQGDVVRLFNERGSSLVGAILCDAMMPGTISLPTGATWSPAEASAGLDLAGNPNALTNDSGSSRLSQGAASGNCLVQAERVHAVPNLSEAWRATRSTSPKGQ